MRNWVFVSLIFCLSLDVIGQGYGNRRQTKDAFPQQPRYEKSHWYFDLGVNYPLPVLSSKEQSAGSDNFGSYKTQLNPKGRIGFNAAFGRYHLINNLYFFRYWNYGIHYRWLRGEESYNNLMVVGESSTNIGSGTNTFSDHFAGVHTEIHGVNKLGDKSFLQHTFGLSASYAVLSKRSYTQTLPGIQENTSSKIHGYLYYRFGWGIRAFPKLMIIPSIEVPVLNIYTFNSARPDMPYFNSNFWPFTVSVRFMLCRKYRMKNCPPVDAIGVPKTDDDEEGDGK